MKQKVIEVLDQMSEKTIKLGRTLFETPELGFKEFKTKEILIKELKDAGFEVEREFARTGFQVSLGSGHPHIGLIAELDAIPTLGHPYADLNDQSAAHTCAHSTQCAIMTSVIKALKEVDITQFPGKISLFFTPAEEFTDMAFRRDLIAKGELHYPAGKIEMLHEGIFDDVDLCLHLHAMGNDHYHFASDSHLAGFIYKKFTFVGKASHAAVLPHLGVNALNAFALFQSAAGMLRETFIDEDKNRFHGIVTEGGQTVNSIPERIVYEGYVRSFNTANMKLLSEKLTHAAKHCAEALGAECIVEDTPGYLPFKPCHELSLAVEENMLHFCKPEEILHDEKSVAAGDIGDLGMFVPTIQFGYGGVGGVIHGKNMFIQDEERLYIESAKVTAMTVIDLMSDPAKVQRIKDSFTPVMSKEEYFAYLNQK
ncbi:MAG: amidohydrolase [Erysipelotrichaceae bacterium]|nr:amidohydrolase [Erysipelotrichaceae bacterium]